MFLLQNYDRRWAENELTAVNFITSRFIPFWFLILTTQSRNLSEYCIATNTNRLEPSVCGLKTAPCDGDPRHSLTPSSFLFLHHSTSSNFWLHDAKIDQHQSGLSLSLFLFHVLVFFALVYFILIFLFCIIRVVRILISILRVAKCLVPRGSFSRSSAGSHPRPCRLPEIFYARISMRGPQQIARIKAAAELFFSAPSLRSTLAVLKKSLPQ